MSMDLPAAERAIFTEAPKERARMALDDLAAYLCLFDIEYEFEMSEGCPKNIALVRTVGIESPIDVQIDRIRELMRARQGCSHKIAFWLRSLGGRSPEAHGHDATDRGAS